MNSPLTSRHDSLHKLVEERHCESGVAVIWTPNHALDYQTRSKRPQGVSWLVKNRRYVTRAVRTRTQFRHRSEVVLLLRSQSVKTDTKETLIQCGNCFGRSRLNILKRDRTNIGNIPRMLPPFLKKIGIPVSLFNYFIGSLGNIIRPLFACGLDDRQL